MDGTHWSAQDHDFGEATAVGVSEAKLDHDYNYKTGLKFWKENKEFERQNISMSRPHLHLTPIGTNTSNAKISHLDSNPVGRKTSDPKPLKRPMKLSKIKEESGKEYVPEKPESDPSLSDPSLSESDF